MNIWSPDSRQPRLGRKVIPEGSNEFQKVLDQILSSEDQEDDGNLPDVNHQTSTQFVQDACYCKCKRDRGSHFTSPYNEDENLAETNLKLKINKKDKNNNSISALSCMVDKYQDYKIDISEGKCFSDTDTVSFLKHTEPEYFHPHQEEEKENLEMGTSCSSNIYDHREWHNVKGDSIESTKPKKRGRLLKKRLSGDRAVEKINGTEIGTEKNQISPNACNCQQQEDASSDAEQPTRPLSFQSNGLKSGSDNKRTSLSPDDIFDLNSTQLTSNRLSPNVDSSGHVQISRVVGSGRARATADCDVSPHRLLTRRSNSPKSRQSSQDSESNASYKERQRSYSWSNGKLGTKTSFKTSSLIVRSSHTNPLKNLMAGIPQTLADKSGKTSPTSQADASDCSVALVNEDTHDPQCPLHIKPEEVPKISISKAQIKQDSFDPDLAPVTRRRAASESQTMRTRAFLRRTPDSSDQIQERVHVRWADEEKGSSLSTSVFLSSIRPRSHSYGAMDSVPHRPILKKGQAF